MILSWSLSFTLADRPIQLGYVGGPVDDLRQGVCFWLAQRSNLLTKFRQLSLKNEAPQINLLADVAQFASLTLSAIARGYGRYAVLTVENTAIFIHEEPHW